MKKYGAYGLVEVKGESNAVIVVDRMLKTAEVEYVTQDTKCGGHALVFVGGSVSAVTAAGPSDSQTRKYDIRKEIDSCADFKRKLSTWNLGER